VFLAPSSSPSFSFFFSALRSRADERLKLLGAALAGHLAQREAEAAGSKPGATRAASSNVLFKELCGSLSSELDDAFLRAMFAYIANGDWQDVLDEVGLPLKDRLAVAIRFLPDDEVRVSLHCATF
jgi:hypothetical protein